MEFFKKSQLPLPMENQTGWPWTSDLFLNQINFKSNQEFPKISIITPNYNNCKYLEETIRSVLIQGYPNLEYILMDGGSTDQSIEIIKKYEPFISYWESGQDNGQADAIYRGFKRSTGSIIAYINSDDFYLPNSFQNMVNYFLENPQKKWAVGNGIFVDEKSQELLKCFSCSTTYESLVVFGSTFIQPTMFIKREEFINVGGFDTKLEFCFDLDLILNLAKRSNPGIINNLLCAFRIHTQSKTYNLRDVQLREDRKIREAHKLPFKREIIPLRLRYGIQLFFHRCRTSGIYPFFKWKIINFLPRRY